MCDEFDGSETSENLENTQKLVYSSENKEICESEKSEILSTIDVFQIQCCSMKKS